MWILIVLQLVAAAPTPGSYQPLLYNGVTMQEFVSKESCENAAAKIKQIDDQKFYGNRRTDVSSGVLALECVKK